MPMMKKISTGTTMAAIRLYRVFCRRVSAIVSDQGLRGHGLCRTERHHSRLTRSVQRLECLVLVRRVHVTQQERSARQVGICGEGQTASRKALEKSTRPALALLEQVRDERERSSRIEAAERRDTTVAVEGDDDGARRASGFARDEIEELGGHERKVARDDEHGVGCG